VSVDVVGGGGGGTLKTAVCGLGHYIRNGIDGSINRLSTDPFTPTLWEIYLGCKKDGMGK
jgi:hypothetical protein